MSLRRAAGNKKSLIPPYTTAVVTPSLTGHGQRHPRSSWILSGVAVLFVAGIFISSLSPREEDNEQFNVRSSSNGEHPHRIPDFEPVHKECSVWIAASSVRGLQGYGVFTTRDLAKDESILGVPDGVSIPITGYRQRHIPKGSNLKEEWIKVWDNYWWGSGVPDHVSYEAGTDVTDYQIAFGALPNHHCLLAKLSYIYPHPPYDDSLVDRFQDPGAGAFTYSRGRQFTVSDKVKAGSEIFLNYGHCRHGIEGEPNWLEHAYVSSDFNEAASLIWETLQGEEKLRFDDEGRLLPPKRVERLVLDLLPETRQELKEMGDAVSSKSELAYYVAEHKSLTQRSPEWVRAHGMCLENLIPLPSTLLQAGQGAFAQYRIRKDEVVMPAPLLQIMDREVLALYNEDDESRVNDQVLINYCFGHAESTILLCPDTQAVLINHCSKRTKDCGKKGPNAAIRWSRGWDPTSDDWRQMSLEELAQQPGRGLAFEVYATRTILPGEEVFLDYGVAWEEAWARHVKTWKPPKSVKDWITAVQANEVTDRILPEFMAGDLGEEVDHPYLFTACQYYSSTADRHSVYQKGHDGWWDLTSQEILSTFADDGSSYGYSHKDLGYAKHDDTSHWPCSVLLEENPVKGSYTVRIHQNPWEEDTPWETNEVPRILTGYARSDIHYFVKPYASDQNLPGAFRHPLGIPDELLPDQWKNLKN